MMQRTSIVNHMKVSTVSFSSIIEIGDSSIIQGFSRALAVQRQTELFFGHEGDFESYSIFKEPIPFHPIDENISINTTQLNPFIKVNNIDVIGVSSSSIFQIGNSQQVSMETRVKHIRQLRNGNSKNEEEKEENIE